MLQRGAVCLGALFLAAALSSGEDEALARHRNLGKAFYENPTTQIQAVEEFRKALALAPDSPRERINYGLALLRAGKTAEGIAALERAQKQDPRIPHTWFNLGVQYKKQGEAEKAIAQLERMVQLVPDDPISHYNLGAAYKLAGRTPEALREFETTARLDPRLAAPRFQLFNAYRIAGRKEEAMRELQIFQRIKQEQEGAAIPEDPEWNYYAEVLDEIDPPEPDRSTPAALRFTARKLGAADPGSAGLATVDADGDGLADLLVWSSAGLALYRSGGSVMQAGLPSGAVIHAAAGDFDNDGLADLCVLSEAGVTVWRNAGGRFQKAASLAAARFEHALWIDYDHDYDLDLLLLGKVSKLYRNQGEGGFADRTADFPFVPGHATGAVAFRMVADSKSMDVAVAYRDRPGVLYRDKLGGVFAAEPLPDLPSAARSLVVFDADANGELDLAFSHDGTVWWLRNVGGRFSLLATGARGGHPCFADLENRFAADLVAGNAVYRVEGPGRFGAARTQAGLPTAAVWAGTDFDGDGRVDLAAVGEDGTVQVLWNQTAANNHWLRVKLEGVKNGKLAHGAEVEIRAGRYYAKRLYEGVPLHFGLRGSARVDALRITWPNGLIQSETLQPGGRLQIYKEAQRLSGSCPMIFTWNGREFEFITDVLGVAPLGASAGDGEFFPVDHDEYIQIPGRSLAPRHGFYEVRITEELSEVAYLDRVSLLVVDHPASTLIVTNDKFQGPPFPEFRLYGVERKVRPRSARQGGQDVLARITDQDRMYADRFRRDLSGVGETWALELDFGASAPDHRAVLVLHGWVDWADGSTFLGVAQQGRGGLRPPSLQVKDARGQWRTVLEDMGMPAGKPKTIAVDLTGMFLSASRELRIVTNLCLYVDEIYLSEATAPPLHTLVRLAPHTADLRFRGFSEVVVHPQRLQPERFLYSSVRPSSMWNPTPGFYTRYGEVADLLAAGDDRLVIMGSGDEVALRFDARGLSPPPRGWIRDFLLHVEGWAKDRDPNTAFSQSVEPLPFRGMRSYPYGPDDRYPDTAALREWKKRYNLRPALRLLRPLARREGGLP